MDYFGQLNNYQAVIIFNNFFPYRKKLTFRAKIPSSGPVFSTGAMGRTPITLKRRVNLAPELGGAFIVPDVTTLAFA